MLRLVLLRVGPHKRSIDWETFKEFVKNKYPLEFRYSYFTGGRTIMIHNERELEDIRKKCINGTYKEVRFIVTIKKRFLGLKKEQVDYFLLKPGTRLTTAVSIFTMSESSPEVRKRISKLDDRHKLI